MLLPLRRPRFARTLLICSVMAMLLAATPVAPAAANQAAGKMVGPTVTGPTTSGAPIPFLNLSMSLANRLHRSLLNQSSGGYYYSESSNWTAVTSAQYSTLGNAFIVAGLLQLYQATENRTYLLWAATTSNQFWNHAWARQNGGFYDTYYPNWERSTCSQLTQDNAMFEIDFLSLFRLNGSSEWLQRAGAVDDLLNSRFWSATNGIVEVGYDSCTGLQSGDVNVELSIGSYLWATGEWTWVSGNASYMARMNSAASFAHRYLWDGVSNTLPGGPHSIDCSGPGGALGFMRSVYANLSGLEDCRKGANENIWCAMGFAELYSLTGNSTLLAWTSQDLNWINSTLWDPTNGGYHNDVFRNDTLRSACSSTNDPRDYPGWTEGEQPMFWWNIGKLSGNATSSAWSQVAEKWTAGHQWNYTNGNGGDMTCLNSDMLPDKGSPDLYDWVQGSALYSFSTIGSVQASSSTISTFSSTALTASPTTSFRAGTTTSATNVATTTTRPVTLTGSSAGGHSSSTSVATNGGTTTASYNTPAWRESTTYLALGALGLIVVTAVGFVLHKRKSLKAG